MYVCIYPPVSQHSNGTATTEFDRIFPAHRSMNECHITIFHEFYIFVYKYIFIYHDVS